MDYKSAVHEATCFFIAKCTVPELSAASTGSTKARFRIFIAYSIVSMNAVVKIARRIKSTHMRKITDPLLR